MTTQAQLQAQVNQVYSDCIDDVLSDPSAKIFDASDDCKDLLMITKTYIETNELESIADFEMMLNAPFFDRITALKDFRKRKQKIIDEEAKREILEKSASDIMFDMERLTNEEHEHFERQYGEMTRQMIEEIARLPSKSQPDDEMEFTLSLEEKGSYATEHDYKINYRIFDFEAVFKLRVDMLEYLSNRDRQWVPQLMP